MEKNTISSITIIPFTVLGFQNNTMQNRGILLTFKCFEMNIHSQTFLGHTYLEILKTNYIEKLITLSK